MIKLISSKVCKRGLLGFSLGLAILNPLLAKADLLQSLYSVFGSAGKAACELAADGLAFTALPACSSSDTLNNPTDLICRFTRSDCSSAYAQGAQTVDAIEQAASECLSDPLSCSRQAFTEACDLTGTVCEQAYDAMTSLQGCVSASAQCSWQILELFGSTGQQACQQVAQLVPALPPTVNQCDNVYTRFNEASDCLLSADRASCLNNLFAHHCVDAASYFPHRVEDCEALSNLVDEGIHTLQQCLNNLLQCPQDLLQQLNSGVIRLQGQILDQQQQPLIGVMVSAVPVTDDVLLVASSTHVALTNGEGEWHIDINPAFSFKGEYRVNATGVLHDFFAINNMPRLSYVVTVE